MAEKTRTQLKGIFITGARPTQQDYHDALDSFVHKSEQGSISETTINQAIAAYDATLRAESPDGTVNTLGDVFKVFQGFADTRNLNAQLSWAGLPGRPSQLNVAYGEQQVILSNHSFSDSSSFPVTARQIAALAGTRRAFVADIGFVAHRLNTSQGNNVLIYSPVSVLFGLDPVVST